MKPIDKERNVTKTFTITCSQSVMNRFEQLLAMLHFNSGWGHSAIFAMPLDGDGAERFAVRPKPRHSKEVELLASIGGDVEIANGRSFTAKRLTNMGSSWIVKNGRIYKNGEIGYKVESMETLQASQLCDKEETEATPASVLSGGGRRGETD